MCVCVCVHYYVCCVQYTTHVNVFTSTLVLRPYVVFDYNIMQNADGLPYRSDFTVILNHNHRPLLLQRIYTESCDTDILANQWCRPVTLDLLRLTFSRRYNHNSLRSLVDLITYAYMAPYIDARRYDVTFFHCESTIVGVFAVVSEIKPSHVDALSDQSVELPTQFHLHFYFRNQKMHHPKIYVTIQCSTVYRLLKFHASD